MYSNTNNQPNNEDSKNLSSNWDQAITKFEELQLNPDLLRGVFGKGFIKPSVIQQKGILPLIKGRDTIAQAQSGSGKTATFLLGTLQLIDKEALKVQALILAPTRELADQIYKVMGEISVYMDLKLKLLVGGTDTRRDRDELNSGVHAVVGTPGRVFDMLRRGHLNTDFLKIFILDEADEMLGMGFLEQVNDILKLIPSDSQIGFFSATLPPKIVEMCNAIMNDPVRILVKESDLTLKGIKQFYISCSSDEVKLQNMIIFFSNIEVTQCMIYVNKRERVEWLAHEMKSRNFVVSCIHGQMKQDERKSIMQEFRSGSSRILISTDLLARGIDVQPVEIVINFDLPSKKESYIHRVGRSGRFGRRGIALNLVSKLEARILIEIEEHYTTQVEKLPDDLSELNS